MARVCSSSYFILATLSTLIISYSCFIQLPIMPSVWAQISFSSTCGEPAWIQVPCHQVPELVSECNSGWADHLCFSFPETERPPDICWTPAGSHRDCGNLVTWMECQPEDHLAKWSQKEILCRVSDDEHLPLGLLTFGNSAKIPGFSNFEI